MARRKQHRSRPGHRPATAPPARARVPAGRRPGHPFVSAAFIVKDEQDNLPAALAAAKAVADELVVYDTGSTDATVELARAAGAVVVEGFWDDDFGRARNAAIEHCRGTWVLVVDADEQVSCADPASLRATLAAVPAGVDGLSVLVENLTGAGLGSGYTHTGCRIFRRDRCCYLGRLHEQVVRRSTLGGITMSSLDPALVHIVHTGYLDEQLAAKDKTARNLRLAEAEYAQAEGFERAFSLFSLGRSYSAARNFDAGARCCLQAAELTGSPATRRMALAAAAEALLQGRRLDEALAVVDRLRAVCTSPVLADVLEARLRVLRAEFPEALARLDALPHPARDDDGFEYTPAMLAGVRAEALLGVGRAADAADLLLATLRAQRVLDTHLANLTALLVQTGRPLTELAAAIPAERTTAFLAQVLQMDAGLADDLLEACFGTFAGTDAVLATAASLAVRLPVERMLVWSARLRGRGYPAACPLVAAASDVSVPPVLRARAAATAVRAFGDLRAAPAHTAALEAAGPGERAEILAETAELCPALLAAGPPAPLLAVVVPCRDAAERTAACLRGVQGSLPPGSYRVVLVDNGSTDATRELAGSPDGLFTVLHLDPAVPFAAAAARGVAGAGSGFALVLSPDVVLTPGVAEALLAALQADPAGAAVRAEPAAGRGGVCVLLAPGVDAAGVLAGVG